MNLPDDLIVNIRNANRITVLTGAGISAESGIPTFREAQTGLWERYSPEELATPQAFQRNPHLVWEWYSWRRELIRKAEVNPGHLALSQMEKRVDKFTLITQNVDGLHIRAGSKNVIELHGNIMRTICFNEREVIDQWEDSLSMPPRCPNCDGYLRPDVVWYGEGLPQESLNEAITASQSPDIFFSIGTSAFVQPAASLPIYALESGAILVEVNPRMTPLAEHCHYSIQEPAGSILPELVQIAWSESTKG
jgi:NAD-dependent deacetylase